MLAAFFAAGCGFTPPAASPQTDWPALGAAEDDHRDTGGSSATSSGYRVSASEISIDDNWHFHGVPGRRIDSPHYRILTTLRDGAPSRTVHMLPYFVESALHHYRTALGRLPRPRRVMTLYVFENQQQWERKTRELLPSRARSFRRLGRGGFTTDGTAVIWYIGRWDTLSIAAHEGWHQYTQSTFKQKLPVWLEEGIAVYMEGFTFSRDGSPMFNPQDNTERWSTLRRAVHQDDLMALEQLLTIEPEGLLNSGKQSLLVYYAQVWALTRFLVEGNDGQYAPALHDLLADAAHGRLVNRLSRSSRLNAHQRRTVLAQEGRGPGIIKEYFDTDIDAFRREYETFVNKIVEVPVE